MTSPSFYAAGTGASGTGNISVRFPATVPAGMDALLCIMTANQPPATPPSGWAELDGSPRGIGSSGAYPDSVALSIYRKKTTGAEGGTTVPIADTGTFTVGFIYLIADARSDAPINAVSSAVLNFTSEPAIQGPVTSVDGCYVLTIYSAATAAAYTTAGHSNDTLSSYAKVGDYDSIALAAGVDSAAGATGTSQMTASVDTRWAIYSIAFEPEPAELPAITGGMAPKETGSDTADGHAYTEVSGAAAAIERTDDRFAAAATAATRGAVQVTEAGADRAVAQASNRISGALIARGDNRDVPNAQGASIVEAAVAADEQGADALKGTGAGAIDNAPAPIAGRMASRESGYDVARISGQAKLRAELHTVEQGADGFACEAAAPVAASMSIQEFGRDQWSAEIRSVIGVRLAAAGYGADAILAGVDIHIAGAIAAMEFGADRFRAFGPAGALSPLPAYRVARPDRLSRATGPAALGRAGRSVSAQLGV